MLQGVFGVVFDETDHVFFVCPECGSPMIVESVELVEHSRKLWLSLRCTRCGYRARRKLYYGMAYASPVERVKLATRIVDLGKGLVTVTVSRSSVNGARVNT